MMSNQPLSFLIKADSTQARSEIQKAVTAIGGLGSATVQVNEAAVKSWRETQAAVNGAAGAVAAATRRVQGEADQAKRQGMAVTGNLIAQFNDIGMMLAAGQSPLMLAVQQGGQVSQALGPLGAAGAARALGAAFVGLLSPVNLITMGVIAGGAALAQWGMAALSAGEDTRSLEEKVADLAEATKAYESAAAASSVSLSDLKQKYGDMADEVYRVLQAERELAQYRAQAAANEVARSAGFDIGMTAAEIEAEIAARQRLSAIMVELNSLNEGFKAEGMGMAEAWTNAVNAMQEAHPEQNISAAIEAAAIFEDRLRAITSEYHISADAAQDLALASARMAEAEGIQNQAMAAERLHSVLIEVFGSIGQADDATDGLASRMGLAAKSGAEVSSAADSAKSALDQAAGGATDLWNALQDAATAAGTIGGGVDDASSALERAVGGARVLLRVLGEVQAALRLQIRLRQSDTGGTTEQVVPSSGLGMPGQSASLVTSPRPRRAPQNVDFGDSGEDSGAGSGAGRSGGGGGGRSAAGSLSALQEQGRLALAAMALAVDGINEKVKAGLLSTSEGVESVRSAKERTANALAELLPKIAAVGGPQSVQAVENLREALKGLADEVDKAGAKLHDLLVDAITKPFEDLFVNVGKGKEAFADFTNSVLTNIARIVSQKFTERFIEPLVEIGLKWIGYADGGVIEGGEPKPYALGGVIEGGRGSPAGAIQAFAMGGLPGLEAYSNAIVDQPTLFAMGGGKTGLMGEAGPEAIVPLARGAYGLGVRASGADGRETVLPLQRASGGALGVKLPEWAQAFAMGGMPNVALPVWQPPSAPAMAFARGGVPSLASPQRENAAEPGAAGNVIVNVTSNIPGATATAQKRQSGQDTIIEVLLDAIPNAVASDLARGGPVSEQLQANFGLTRQGR